jgi:outer membrane immunogenic protein
MLLNQISLIRNANECSGDGNMKHIVVAALAMTALGSASALAADLPPRPTYKAEPVMMAPAPTWTGCYIGGNIGGAFGNASASAPGGEVSGNGSGFAGGGQVGCDYQFGGVFVIGFRELLDYTSNNKSGTIGAGPLAGTVVNFNNQWFDTLTARLGYAVQPTWLLYFQGGAAWAHTSTNFSGPLTSGQTSNSRTGWTIGGGVEWMFAPHWSAFLEGNYMDFGSNSGSVSVTVVGAGTTVYPVTAKTTESNVLVGVNYHFF